MVKGAVAGGVWGLVVAGVGLSAASLIAPQPAGNAPPQPPLIEAPQGGSGDLAESRIPEDAGPTPDAPPAAETAAEADSAPLPDPVSALADTTPADVPLAPAIDTGLDLPSAIAPADLRAVPDSPVLPNPQAIAPQVPGLEKDVVLSTEPASPARPPDTTDAGAAELTQDPAPEVIVIVEPEPAADTVADSDAGPADPAPEPAEPAAAETEPEPDPETAPETAPEPDPLPEQTSETDLELGPDTGADTGPENGPDNGSVSDIADQAPQDPDPAPQPRIVLRGEAASLPAVETGVRVNRPAGEVAAEADAASEPADAATGPALVAHAAAFDNPDDLPLLSVVLIDDGSIAGLDGAVATIPFPVSIAIDPGSDGASGRMAAYRASGIEVLALARLPVGAQPTDAEVTLESVFSSLPASVALLDAGEGGLQANSAVTDQAMARLAADGRGFVTVTQGLNMAVRAADAADVPAGTIYRDLDGNDQDAAAIRRFLDQAAFRARQEGRVILLGRLRPDTISALILWGTANRAGQVAMAPISAILTAP